MKYRCLSIPMLVFAGTAFGSLTGPGDIAFTGFNADGGDDFALVCLTDMDANQVVEFCDDEWNGTNFGTGESDFRWTAPSNGVAAGTVVTFNDIDSAGPSVSIGSIEGDRMGLSASGETIYGYLGTNRTPTAFLGIISTTVDSYDGTAGTLSGTGCTLGREAILLQEDIDGAQYQGVRTGATAFVDYVPLVGDTSTWQIVVGGAGDQSGEILPFDTTPFTLAGTFIPFNVVAVIAPVPPPVVTTAPGVAVSVAVQSLSNGTIDVGYEKDPGIGAWTNWVSAGVTNAASPYIATAAVAFPSFGMYYYAGRWSDGDFTYYGVNVNGQTNAVAAAAEYMVVVTNPTPPRAGIVITEIMSSSSHPGGSANADWFEMYNPGPDPIDLTGYSFDDADATPGVAFFTNIVIGPDGVFIVTGETLGREAAWIEDWGMPSNNAWNAGGTAFQSFSSTGDELHIYDTENNEIAMVAFGQATNGSTFAWDIYGQYLGISMPGVYGAYIAPSNGAGAGGTDIGSPGIVVPEPALFGLALATAFLLRALSTPK